MKIGYIRVSSQEQNTIRQEVLMESLGVDAIYIDRMSGKNTDRPELKKMMEFVRQGDTVIVESISRFARNTKDLLEQVEQLTAKEVESTAILLPRVLVYHLFGFVNSSLRLQVPEKP